MERMLRYMGTVKGDRLDAELRREDYLRKHKHPKREKIHREDDQHRRLIRFSKSYPVKCNICGNDDTRGLCVSTLNGHGPETLCWNCVSDLEGKCGDYLVKRQAIQKIVSDMKCQGAMYPCGDVNIRHLDIHHKNGGGEEHRRSLGVESGFEFYLWFLKHGDPKDYEVLCKYCHAIKERMLTTGQKWSGSGREVSAVPLVSAGISHRAVP
jgi:hypothetical protein